MKVLHITAIGAGGAGIACRRQHMALRNARVDSKMLLLAGKNDPSAQIYSVEATDPDFEKTMQRYKRQRSLLNVKVRLNGKTPELFSAAHSVWEIEKHPLVKEADVIHLHWVAGMIDLERFFAVVQKPVVWTLHDAWSYTGGFHYERYWNSASFAKLSAPGIELRKKLFRNRAIKIVTPSQYLLDECRNSGVFAQGEFHHVPNCIDETFRLHAPKNTERTTQQWFFACDELDYYRKGAHLLFEAFAGWKSKDALLVVAGKAGKLKAPDDKRIFFQGHVDTQEINSTIGKSDAIIHPSLEDNLPNIIAEAHCCGTPVLATPVGGVPEMITPGFNGILAKATDSASLRNAFDELLQTAFDREAISAKAQETYSPAEFARRMTEIYK